MLASRVDTRRFSPRVPVESLCSEVAGDQVRHAHVLDVSAGGVRLQRPLGGPRARVLQLELELPGIDEIVWASGEICFDQVWNAGRTASGGRNLVRTSGVRLIAAASRHARMLREFAMDRGFEAADRRLSRVLVHAACYRFG